MKHFSAAQGADPECASYFYSIELKRSVETVADAAIAFLFTGMDRCIAVGTEPVVQASALASVLALPTAATGAGEEPAVSRATDATAAGARRLNRIFPAVDGSSQWQLFHFGSPTGAQETVALRLKDPADAAAARKLLATAWKRLRAEFLSEARREVEGVGNDALLWLVTHKIDLAMLVLNHRGFLLKANTAAKDLIEQGHLLRPGRGGIEAATACLTRAFREAVHDCAVSSDPDCERVVLLESGDADRPVPVTLLKFPRPDRASDLVVALLPANPAAERVCRLATELGLTQAEARVASLLQMGLPNREAAARAGVTEQTFATYAKRVLNKLQVNSRAEVAQLLTWQAVGGRV